MTCEHCGAPLRPDTDRGLFICDYCGSELLPPTAADGVMIVADSKFNCPLCKGKLADAALESIPLLYCRECHGMFIAMDDLEPLVSSLRVNRDRPATYLAPRGERDLSRQLRCPRCSVEMDCHAYGGGGNVNVDSCEACESIWLDSGELRKIVAAPDHEPVYLNHGNARDQ
jgi:Zn-finger nucleic acid-binding protein